MSKGVDEHWLDGWVGRGRAARRLGRGAGRGDRPARRRRSWQVAGRRRHGGRGGPRRTGVARPDAHAPVGDRRRGGRRRARRQRRLHAGPDEDRGRPRACVLDVLAAVDSTRRSTERAAGSAAALQVAERAVADEGRRRRVRRRSRNDGSRHSSAWSSTRPAQSRCTRRAARRCRSPGWSATSVTPGSRSNSARSTAAPRAGRARDEVVGEHHALLGGEAPEREADDALGVVAAEPQRQPEVDRQLEVDVEELGPELERAEVAVEVADVEAPEDRPLDLGPALARAPRRGRRGPTRPRSCGGTRRRRRAGSGSG